MNFTTRKIVSHERLRKWKIPVNEDLPEIEDLRNCNRRNTREVAERAIGLSKVYLTSQNVPHSELDKSLREFDSQYLTPKEIEFILGNRGQTTIVQASWSIEALHTLLWSLSFFDEMTVPTTLCDVNKTIGIVRSNGLEGFFKDSLLRDQEQVLDQCDFIYRCHWAIVEMELLGVETKLVSDVVVERHRALNWLVQGVQWDDISLDT